MDNDLAPHRQEPTPSAYAAQYRASRQRIRSVLTDLPAGRVEARVPACPDWTVSDLCAHLAGVCSDLVARRWPGGDAQAWVDAQVASRRGRPVGELLDEWDAAGPDFEAAIEARPKAFAGLVYDVVAHEHDLRAAVDRPGARDSEGVVASMFLATQLMTTDLQAQGLQAVRLRAGEHEWVAGTGDQELALDLDDVWELFRLTGSRRSESQLRAAPWQGDLDRYLPGLAHMPLPTTDLVE